MKDALDQALRGPPNALMAAPLPRWRCSPLLACRLEDVEVVDHAIKSAEDDETCAAVTDSMNGAKRLNRRALGKLERSRIRRVAAHLHDYHR